MPGVPPIGRGSVRGRSRGPVALPGPEIMKKLIFVSVFVDIHVGGEDNGGGHTIMEVGKGKLESGVPPGGRRSGPKAVGRPQTARKSKT